MFESETRIFSTLFFTLFSLLYTPPVTALVHHRTRRVCRILNKFENFKNETNYTIYTTVNCYHSCCDEGCCIWSTGSLVLILIVVVICSCKCLKMYWRANCTKQDSGANSQENILMDLQNFSRDYGTSDFSPPPPYHIASNYPQPGDKIPTYEEACNQQCSH
ncbi:uncharacterized protein LOC123010010 [Tribolium madens]|uniref:uncharacterized protein LOC123010010 n=1 Tax=Tribolium madens TaxID=41895 RepID=UPI001CF75C1C|nr:uncharacterized protein LOC123010010 [Tribolium madens]